MSFALELSPPPRSIGLFKIRQIANAGPDRDNFDLIDLVKDFKFHSQPFLLQASSKCSKVAKDFSRCHLLLTTLSTERFADHHRHATTPPMTLIGTLSANPGVVACPRAWAC
jgi:hypothetical protein